MDITIFICVIILGPPQYALPNEEAVHSIFYSAVGTDETRADKPWTIYLKQVGGLSKQITKINLNQVR